MTDDCPACYPRPTGPVCEDCKRILARGGFMVLFYIMECGFGVAMALSAVSRAWIALAVFVLAAFMAAYMVIREDS